MVWVDDVRGRPWRLSCLFGHTGHKCENLRLLLIIQDADAELSVAPSVTDYRAAALNVFNSPAELTERGQEQKDSSDHPEPRLTQSNLIILLLTFDSCRSVIDQAL